jgi:hypothetical protein
MNDPETGVGPVIRDCFVSPYALFSFGPSADCRFDLDLIVTTSYSSSA